MATARIPIEPYVSPRPGWAEQDPELYWLTLGDACRQVLADPAVRRDAIAGLTITTQRNTIVVTDVDGRPIRPAIVWLDQRRTEGLPFIGGTMGLAFRALGLRETVAGFMADCEATWLRANEPETWGAIRHYLGLSGFLIQRLVGRFVDSAAAQVGYLPFDYKAQAWAAPGDWKWTAAPVDPAWLPDLVPPTGRLGELTAEAATATGLPAGLPVIASAADKACEVLGTGALTPDMASLSFGTTATVNTTVTRYTEPIRYVPAFPAAIPGAWTMEIGIYRGYWMVEWFKREFGHKEVEQAAAAGVAPEVLFDELVRAVPAGSMGLTLQPYWSPGVRDPGAGGEGRHHRVRRRPHPGARLSGDPGGDGVRPARGRRPDGEADRRPDHLTPDRGRRVAEPGGRPAHRRRVRSARGARPHARGVGAGRGDRCGGGARASPGCPDGGGRDGARR